MHFRSGLKTARVPQSFLAKAEWVHRLAKYLRRSPGLVRRIRPTWVVDRPKDNPMWNIEAGTRLLMFGTSFLLGILSVFVPQFQGKPHGKQSGETGC